MTSTTDGLLRCERGSTCRCMHTHPLLNPLKGSLRVYILTPNSQCHPISRDHTVTPKAMDLLSPQLSASTEPSELWNRWHSREAVTQDLHKK